MSGKRTIQTLIGLIPMLLVTLVPMRTFVAKGYGIWAGEVPFWILVAALLLYILFVERRPLSSIGFRTPRLSDLGLAVLTGLLMTAGIVAIAYGLFPLLHLQYNVGEVNKLLATPFLFRFFLVTRAAVSEEILFRGYPIERIEEMTGSRWPGAILSCAAFTYAHLGSWGAAHLIIAGFGGVMLTALYLWRRNLWANMLAHWIADGIGFLLPH